MSLKETWKYFFRRRERSPHRETTETLEELAQERLLHLRSKGWAPTTLERIWALSVLESTVAGHIIEPDIDTLKKLTTARVWLGVEDWHPEHSSSLLSEVVISHRLAIVERDDDWLTELHACWDACPKEFGGASLRAQGEIGLALAPRGPRPGGWSDEELSELGFPNASAPQDRAWCALAQRSFVAARQAIAEYERVLAALPQTWKAAPSEGLRQILCFPDVVFQVERRALTTLLERAES